MDPAGDHSSSNGASPSEDGYVESFNGKLRDELIDREIFTTLEKSGILMEQWRKEYNRGQVSSINLTEGGETMDVSTLEFWKMFGAALLSGGIVGLERQIRGKPSGIRTSILICLGTALFVSLGKSLVDVHTDPTRVLGQVVTGIGFLGAGVIVARGRIIAGVTSAAAIWTLAAIGAMIGFEYYSEAIVIAILIVGILVGIGFAEGKYNILRRGVHAPEAEGQGGKARRHGGD
jgi:putative Mg2+ transporter-C (MgtC) family protein